MPAAFDVDERRGKSEQASQLPVSVRVANL